MHLNPLRPVFLLLFLVLALPAPRPALAASRDELDDRAVRAGSVFRELGDAPDSNIPQQLMADSRCVAVVPNVIKGAWLLGGRFGKGLLSCRSSTGDWSPPVHVMLTGGSFGLQFGVSSTDVVLFFMTTRSVRSLLTSKVTLSGEAGVAAGPVGRETEAATDARLSAEIYSYARSRGLFAGVALAGGYLGVDREDDRVYYGKNWSPASILFDGKVTAVPKSAWSFLGALPRPHRKPGAPGPGPGESAAPPSDSAPSSSTLSTPSGATMRGPAAH